MALHTMIGSRWGAAAVRLVTCTLVLVICQPAHSASWFDRLKDAIGGDGEQAVKALSTADIDTGLKEALRLGAETVVDNLGQEDGFNLDPTIRIELPKELAAAQSVLERIGLDGALVDLEVRLNRAAEIATPKARQLFINSITNMTLEDAKGIYDGPADAATQYFRNSMSPELAAAMKPTIDEGLAESGAATAYTTLIERYNNIPFAPEIDADLSNYVVEKGMDGIFHYLALEEAAIREDPAKRTTELLKRVFSKDT